MIMIIIIIIIGSVLSGAIELLRSPTGALLHESLWKTEIVPCGCYVGTSSIGFPPVCLALTTSSTIALAPTMRLFRLPTTSSIFRVLPLLWRWQRGTGVVEVAGVFRLTVSTDTFASTVRHTAVYTVTSDQSSFTAAGTRSNLRVPPNPLPLLGVGYCQ